VARWASEEAGPAGHRGSLSPGSQAVKRERPLTELPEDSQRRQELLARVHYTFVQECFKDFDEIDAADA